MLGASDSLAEKTKCSSVFHTSKPTSSEVRYSSNYLRSAGNIHKADLIVRRWKKNHRFKVGYFSTDFARNANESKYKFTNWLQSTILQSSLTYRAARCKITQHSPDIYSLSAQVSRPLVLANKQSMMRIHAFVSSFLFLGIIVPYLRADNICGQANPNNNVIDLSEPRNPGPFHDLTTEEVKQLRTFLTQDPKTQAADPETATLNSSYIYTVDLYVARKSEILQHLDHGAPAPERRARVVMFRGDKTLPVVEELVCGPLPDVTSCELLQLKNRRNPVEFSLRPLSPLEFNLITNYALAEVDRKVGHILLESYGSTFTACKRSCLRFQPLPFGSGITKDTQKRLTWFNAGQELSFWSVHELDFAVLVDSTGPDPSKWTVNRVFYAGQIFNDLDALARDYESGRINKSKIAWPVNDENLYSSLKRRGAPLPVKPQRPPTLVEPDGKRYSVKDRQVQYMGWSFNFRSSGLTGPAIYDVRFQGERIAYEIGLSEIAVVYSSHDPSGQTTNYVDSSGESLGAASRALVPGGDCPDTATLIPNVFISLNKKEPHVVKAGFCLFENNNGYPLRRHLAYDIYYNSFYGGMLDSALILRSALTIGNYDYIIDFIFHQNGVFQKRFMSTGYIQTVAYSKQETPYGFQIHGSILGHIHHHFAIFKVDLDMNGTSNRYETLNIYRDKTTLTSYPDIQFSQIKYKSTLKRTEKESVLDYDFNKPKYFVVHNEAHKTKYNQLKGYRIQLNGMSKSLLEEDMFNEPTVTWARHQMVVTKQKDEEISASSIYGMYDGGDPVMKFTSFYTDNENIVDEDLVFWITEGIHHIPHMEDLPVTPTVGNHLTFFLLPYNYFPECPSMGSRDAIFVDLKDPNNPKLGVKVERNGNVRKECLMSKPSLEEDVERDPSKVLQVKE